MRKHYMHRILVLVSLLLLAGLSYAEGLGGKYTTTEEHTFSDCASLEAIFAGGVDKKAVTKLVLTSGSFTAEDWRWLVANQDQFEVLNELHLEGTMASVAVDGNEQLMLPVLSKLTVAKLEKVPTLFKRNWESLREITLPDALEVQSFAFEGLRQVNQILLPKVRKIESQAFWDCTSLFDLGLGAEPPMIEDADLYLADDQLPKESKLMLLAPDGQPLTDDALEAARQRYRVVYDGNTQDMRWWAWSLKDAIVWHYINLILLPNDEVATVQLSCGQQAEEGERVFVKVVPAHGKMVSSVSVQRNGVGAEPVPFDAATSSFVQPEFDVSVKVECVENVLTVAFHHGPGEPPSTFPAGTIEKSGATLRAILDESGFLTGSENKPRRNHVTKIEVKSGAFLEGDYQTLDVFSRIQNHLENNYFQNLEEFVVSDGVANHQRLTSPLSNFSSKPRKIYVAHLHEIGAQAFSSCARLERIELPHMNRLGANSMEYNAKLVELVAPVVEQIGSEALAGAISLESVSFPNLRSLSATAFQGNHRLALMRLGSEPPLVQGANPFDGLPVARLLELVDQDGQLLTGGALQSAVQAYKSVDDGNTSDNLWYGWVISEAAAHDISYEIIEGDGTVDVPSRMAAGVQVQVLVKPGAGQMLEKLTYTPEGEAAVDITKTRVFVMPGKNVKIEVSFGANVFVVKADGQEKSGASITEAVGYEAIGDIKTLEIIGGSITEEGWNSMAIELSSFSSLEKLTIRSTLDYIENLPPLENFYFIQSVENLKSLRIEGVTRVAGSALQSATLEEVELPDLDYLGESVFREMAALRRVEAPKLRVMGQEAFGECTALQRVEFPLLTDLPDYAFKGCTSLREALLPSISEIGRSAFEDCENLQSASYPKVTAMLSRAFAGCSILQTVEIPMAGSIQEEAFMNCSELQALNLPKVIDVYKSVFEGAELLLQVRLLNAKTLHEAAFKGCKTLRDLYIPSLVQVENDVFAECKSLSKLYVGGKPMEVDGVVFKDCPAERSLLFWGVDDKPLGDEEAKQARAAYKAVKDGDTNDELWNGWIIPAAAKPQRVITITVTMKGTSNGIPGVSVRIKRKEDNVEVHQATTDASGQCLINLFDGAYLYACTEPNCMDLDGEFVVNGQDMAMPMEMEAKSVEEYTVTYSAATNGRVSVKYGSKAIASGAKVPKSAKVVIAPIPNKGYRLEKLQINGVDRTADLRDGMLDMEVSEDLTIVASFAEGEAPIAEMCEVTFSAPANGSLKVLDGEKTVESGAKLAKGSELVVEVAANSGYKLAKLMVGEANRTADVQDGKVSFKLEANTKIEAEFVEDTPPVDETYAVTFSAPANGSLKVLDGEKTVESGAKLAKGSELVVEVTANSGYKLAKLMVGEANRTADVQDGKVSFKLEADTKIEAEFAADMKSAVEDVLFAAASVYPNPCISTVQVDGIAGADRIGLYTLHGGLVGKYQLGGAERIELDLSDLAAGIYLLVIESDSGRRAIRMQKQ